MVFLLWGCDSFKGAGQFQSGRQAFLARNYEAALTSFQRVARLNRTISSNPVCIAKEYGTSRLGQKIEDEIDQVRRQESRQPR